MVSNLPEMQETWIQSLARQDPLEKCMATHSSIVAWKIPWTEKPGMPQSMGSQKIRHAWATNILTHFSVKGLCRQSYGFFQQSCTNVRLVPKRRLNTKDLVLWNCGDGEDSWESSGLQGDQPVNQKGNESWILIGRTDAEAPILWPLDAKNWFIGNDPDAGKDWRQKEKKGMTEDEMVGWHHQLNGHEFV